MTTENREWLSALADNELHGRELQRGLDALLQDPALRQRWAHYHAIHEAMHGGSSLELGSRLQQRVSAALAQEPTVLAPRRKPQGWVRQAAGLAVAASVTGVAILGIQHLNQDPAAPGIVPTLVASQNQAVNVAQAESPSAPREWQYSDQLAPYLVNHNEYSSSTNMHGMLPYVRIVGHGSTR